MENYKKNYKFIVIDTNTNEAIDPPEGCNEVLNIVDIIQIINYNGTNDGSLTCDDGDINGDGNINLSDVYLLLPHITANQSNHTGGSIANNSSIITFVSKLHLKYFIIRLQNN